MAVSLRKITDIEPDKIDWEAEWGDWLEKTYDPDNERLEDREI